MRLCDFPRMIHIGACHSSVPAGAFQGARVDPVFLGGLANGG
jgi:hypothetical protein